MALEEAVEGTPLDFLFPAKHRNQLETNLSSSQVISQPLS